MKSISILILVLLAVSSLCRKKHHEHKHKKQTNNKHIKQTNNKHIKQTNKNHIKASNRLKKVIKKQSCDQEKEQLCQGEKQKLLKVSHIHQGSSCLVQISFCQPNKTCQFQSIIVDHQGHIIDTLEGEIDSDTTKCSWIGVTSVQDTFYSQLANRLGDAGLLAVFKKLLQNTVDYDYILTKLDDIGLGGLFVEDLLVAGGMFINQLEVDDVLSGGITQGANGLYDPSSTFQGFDSDRDYKAMAEGKTVKGIYAKRQEGTNPHMQRVLWGRRKKKVVKNHSKHN